MTDHAYRIRDFSELFETNESRKRSGPMEWTKMRTKHDGRSFRRITRAKNGEHALLGWYLMLQVAAKMPARGLLADLQGPLDAEDLADKTGISKKVFTAAMIVLTDEKIGWLERVAWDRNASFDQNLAPLGIQRSGPAESGQAPADTGRHRQTAADNGSPHRTKKGTPAVGGPADNGREQAATGTDRQTTADNGRDRQTTAETGTHNSTGDNITVPPTVPQGGQASERFLDLPSPARQELILAAKKRTCGLGTFRGKNPDRPWGREAMDSLTQQLPVPEEEWKAIEWFHGLAADDTVQELRARRQSETTLWSNWPDEVTRALAYRRKVQGLVHGTAGNGSDEKKEPARWRDFFRWKYEAAVRLPERFADLPRDQRQEWEREHAEFEREHPEQKKEGAAE